MSLSLHPTTHRLLLVSILQLVLASPSVVGSVSAQDPTGGNRNIKMRVFTNPNAYYTLQFGIDGSLEFLSDATNPVISWQTDGASSLGTNAGSRPGGLWVSPLSVRSSTGQIGWDSNNYLLYNSTSNLLDLYVTGSKILEMSGSSVTYYKTLLFGTDNTFNIGASGTSRPASIYSATSMVTPSLLLTGSTSGTITQEAAAVTTTYTIKWPNAQASGSKVLTNDGAGNLSWAAGATYSTIIPGGTVSGTYTGDVYCQGNASLTANTVVDGDLIVVGTLTNALGYSLTVYGDCYCFAGFNFTPTSLATAQNNVEIVGNL